MESQIVTFKPSEKPTLDNDGELIIVKATIEGEKYDAMYENGWWVHFGGNTVGFRDIDENEIEYWEY